MSGEGRAVPVRQGRDMVMTTGGFLTLGSGILSLINGIQGILFEGFFPFSVDVGLSRFDLCGMISTMFGIIAVLGALSALIWRRLSLALVGAALGMLGGGLIGFWLGLAALVVFAFSDADF